MAIYQKSLHLFALSERGSEADGQARNPRQHEQQRLGVHAKGLCQEEQNTLS
jgi:hypothetical protein